MSRLGRSPKTGHLPRLVRLPLKGAEVSAVSVPQLAIPSPTLVRNPVDAVLVAITAYISAHFGVDAVGRELPGGEGEFFDAAIAWIKEGNEAFAEELAVAAHELQDETDGSPSLFLLAVSAGVEAGVFQAKGDEVSAWRRASYSSLLLGIAAGSFVQNGFTINKVMTIVSEKGVEARHAKTRQLRGFAVEKYRAKQWSSANDAAHQLKGQVMAEAKRTGARLSESNAQRTIAEWFRDADKGAKPSS